jgi:hypothetical protein
VRAQQLDETERAALATVLERIEEAGKAVAEMSSASTSSWSGTIAAAFPSYRSGRAASCRQGTRPQNMAGICDTPSPTASQSTTFTLPTGSSPTRPRASANASVRGKQCVHA